MLRFLLLALCLISIGGSSTIAFAQSKASEKLTYVASYNMKGLMTPLAQVTIDTKTVATKTKTYLHTKLEAATYTQYDGYFKIRDVYESYMNPQTLSPSLYKRNVSEGGYTKTEKYVFQPDRKTVTTTTKRKTAAEKTGKFTKTPAAMDVVTALNKIRQHDFSKMQPGGMLAVAIVFDSKEFAAKVKYMGKETINTCLGKKECYKLSLSANTAVMKGKDANLVWITADAKHIPVRFRFSIPVGIGELELKSVN